MIWNWQAITIAAWASLVSTRPVHTLLLEDLLDLGLFPVNEVNQVLEGGGGAEGLARWPGAGVVDGRGHDSGVFGVVVGDELAVLTADAAEEDGEGDEADHAGNDEKAPEAGEGEAVGVLLLELHGALVRRRQPLVADLLQVPVLRQLQDRRRQVHRQRRVPLERLPKSHTILLH